MQFANKAAADEFDRRLKVLRRAMEMSKPKVRVAEEMGAENVRRIPPGSRPAEATALQKIREMAAALAPEATEQYKEQIRINACDYDPETNPALARQLADAEALASYPLGTKEDIDKAVERPTGFILCLC